jgi:hypothetical protein
MVRLRFFNFSIISAIKKIVKERFYLIGGWGFVSLILTDKQSGKPLLRSGPAACNCGKVAVYARAARTATHHGKGQGHQDGVCLFMQEVQVFAIPPCKLASRSVLLRDRLSLKFPCHTRAGLLSGNCLRKRPSPHSPVSYRENFHHLNNSPSSYRHLRYRCNGCNHLKSNSTPGKKLPKSGMRPLQLFSLTKGSYIGVLNALMNTNGNKLNR